MPTISLNPIQSYRLYQFLDTQGKGTGFLLRMQRLYGLFDIERIEGLFERNQEKIETFRADGRPVPRNELEVLRVDDPAREITIDTADLEWISRRIKVWSEDIELPPGKSVEPGQAQDWRIYLPILTAIEAALKK